jgi:hypothetical protein
VCGSELQQTQLYIAREQLRDLYKAKANVLSRETSVHKPIVSNLSPTDHGNQPRLPIHLIRPTTITKMDPFSYPQSKDLNDGLWSPYQYEIPSMFSGVPEPGSSAVTDDQALSVEASLFSHHPSDDTGGVETSSGFQPDSSVHREVEQRNVMTSSSPQPATNRGGRVRRSTRLGDRAPSYTAFFKPVEAFDEGSEDDASAKVRTRRIDGSGGVPSKRHVSSWPSDSYTETEAYTDAGSVRGNRSAMTGNFSIQTHTSGFVSLVSHNQINNNRVALFPRDEPFLVETPTGWCQVTFAARSGVKTGEEWRGLRSRLTECMHAIGRDDPQCTLTGQVYSHCQDILTLLSTSKDFRTMTDTTFSAAINRSLLWAKEALPVSQSSALKRAFSVREQETVKWLQSCLSALLQSHQLAESKRQDRDGFVWPDYVKVANIVYLGENKPAALSPPMI